MVDIASGKKFVIRPIQTLNPATLTPFRGKALNLTECGIVSTTAVKPDAFQCGRHLNLVCCNIRRMQAIKTYKTVGNGLPLYNTDCNGELVDEFL
jgi:hypothetical protein